MQFVFNTDDDLIEVTQPHPPARPDVSTHNPNL